MKTIVKSISTLAVFMAFSSQIFAQNFISTQNISHNNSQNTFSNFGIKSIGFRGGLNFSNMTEFALVQNILPTFENMPAPTFGIFAEIGINKNLSIQPELNFTQKGFMISSYSQSAGDFLGIGIPLGGDASLRLNYIEMSVLAKINLGDAEDTHGYLLAGPAVGYLFDAGMRVDILGIIPIRTDIGTGMFNKIDFSGIAGAGVSVPMGRTNFFVEGRYQYGFSRTLDTGVFLLPVRNSAFGISAGIQIPI